MRKKRYGMGIDLSRCSGCHTINLDLDIVGTR